MSRYCPFCGSVLAKDPSVCPVCRLNIPDREWITEAEHMSEMLTREEFGRRVGVRKKSIRAAVILSVLPAFFGILGLGQIYLDRRDRSGIAIMVLGLALYWASIAVLAAMATSGTVTSLILAIPLVLLCTGYLMTTAVSIRHAATGKMGFLR